MREGLQLLKVELWLMDREQQSIPSILGRSNAG